MNPAIPTRIDAAADEFTKYFLGSFTENNSAVVQAFLSKSHTLLSFVSELARMLEYISPLLSRAPEISKNSFFRATTSCSKEARKLIDAVTQVSSSSPPKVPYPFPPLSLQSAPTYFIPPPGVLGPWRPRSISGLSTSGRRFAPKPPATPATKLELPTSFPEIENLDPTYGLRSEGLATGSLFNHFSKLFSPTKGLAELKVALGGVNELDELASFPTLSRALDPQDYETISAVGGGTIARGPGCTLCDRRCKVSLILCLWI